MLSPASPIPAPLWQLLLDADPQADGPALHAAWLQALVQGLALAGGTVLEAVLVLDGRLLGEQGLPGELRPVAAWPQGSQPCSAELAQLCEEALAQRAPLQRALPGAGLLAHPLLQRGQLQGVVGLRFEAVTPPRQALDWLRWGLGWLLAPAPLAGQAEQDALRERMLLTLELMTAALAEPDWRAACNSAVTEAAHKLGCDRVSLGLMRGSRLRLQALSNAADFSGRLDLAHALEAAMEEASDQGQALCLLDGQPDPELPATAVLREQQALARGFGTGSVLSVPFMLDEHRQGVMVFEWPAAQAPTPWRCRWRAACHRCWAAFCWTSATPNVPGPCACATRWPPRPPSSSAPVMRCASLCCWACCWPAPFWQRPPGPTASPPRPRWKAACGA
ncbi:UNVERIFIED_ORG: GAF domain-containing protein [Shinella sp. XGS7]|nr:GAF domain-containing protein [Shinella sp. XGS7]